MGKGNHSQPQKRDKHMVHKPLVKGRSTSSPAPVNNAKSVERPASPVRSDFRQAHEQVNVNEKAIVDRMIAGLPNLTINPEQVVLEIYAKLGNAYMKASPEMRQQIQEGRLTAHVNYINRLLQEITRHSQPDILLSQIESSRKLLAQYGEEARSFDANGAGIEARIAAAYEERKVIAREKEVKKLVEQVQTNLEELRHYPREADAAYEALVKALDDLGADQARAFPQGVTSREEMDRFIQAAYDAAKVTTARQKFLHFGEAYSGFATPELELAALRKTVATVLGGDATKLVIDPKTAAQMEEEIDQRFCGAMERMASDMLDRKDISGGLRVLFMSSSLDQAEAVIELGINPAAHVRIFERDLGYDRQKPTAEEHARIEAIKHDDADNKAVRLAMVTEEVASAGLAHDAMLDKTLRQIEMAGGVDRLDGVAARFKFGPGEWEGLKRFLAYGAAVRDLTRGAGAEAAPVQAGLTPQG